MYRASVDYGRAKTGFEVTVAMWVAVALCAWGAYVAFVSKRVPDWVVEKLKAGKGKAGKGSAPSPKTFGIAMAGLGGVMILFSLASRALARRSNVFAAYSAF
jgi:hypothetical protein